MIATLFEHRTDRAWCQLALSRDGVAWKRYRQPFLPLGPDGAWDSGAASFNPALIPHGRTLRLYYLGGNTWHGDKERTRGIGLATLRRDGFLALSAGEREGVVVTKPIAPNWGGGVLAGRGRLRVNVKADRGCARVELLVLPVVHQARRPG